MKSTFDSNIQNWSVVGFADLDYLHGSYNFNTTGTYAVNYNPSGGNSGGYTDGYISSIDPPDDGYFTFAAPANFLGNQLVFYNGTISYDLFHLGTVDVHPSELMLVGGGTRLFWQSNPALVPTSTWSHVNVVLAPDAQWKVETPKGNLATAIDFQTVLGNLTGLYILGEYTNSSVETTALDNVRLATTYNFNGHSYLLSKAETWLQAQSEAQSLGGNLITINDQAEQDWLTATFGGWHLWIGNTDQVTEGVWKWISGENSTYNNWRGNEPNNAGGFENYGVLWGDGLWNDWSDSNLAQGIIEINNITNHIPVGSVSISGITTQGQTLTVSNSLTDADGLGAISYQWLNGGNVISGATQTTYILTNADVGKSISVKATYIDNVGTVESVTSNQTLPIANVNDLPTGVVTISGAPVEGNILTIGNTLLDIDGLGSISYQWLSNGEVIKNANQANYTLTPSDSGKNISVKASYTDLQGTLESVNSEFIKAVSSKPTKDDDLLTGTVKNDKLAGLEGNDTLIGGLGSDKLTGGIGVDTFLFTSIDESGIPSKTRDTITDFKHSEGDKIDLSFIDVNSNLVGDQAFTFIGTQPFSTTDATGQLRFNTATRMLYGSTDADKQPEFSILLSGVKSLVAEDFNL